MKSDEKMPTSGVWHDGKRTFCKVLHACKAESVVDSEIKESKGEYTFVESVDCFIMVTQYEVPWRDDLFVDNNDTKQGKLIYGYEIEAPECLESFDGVVLIASMLYADEIKQQLHKIKRFSYIYTL